MTIDIDSPAEVAHSRSLGARSKKSLRAWLQLLKCAKHVEQEISGRFRASHGNSLARFDVLAHLYQAPGNALSTTELAARLFASRGNITRLLDRMESDGLIQRRGNSADRRVSDIHLSRKGRALFAAMAADHEQWADEVFAVLSEGEKDTLVDLLVRVRRRVAGHDG
jgi:DNA-binding MarR family transcriptional regulator